MNLHQNLFPIAHQRRAMKMVFAIKGLEGIKGGAERVLCQIASGMAERGHEVILLSFDRIAGKTFYPLSQKVRRISLEIGNVQKKSGLWMTMRRMLSIRHVLKRERPDCIVAFMISMFVPLSIAMMGTGIRIIGSEHNVPRNYHKRKLCYFLFVISALLLDGITVLSESVKQMYPWIIRRKMIPVSNPVPIPKETDQWRDEDSEHKVVLNVGRLHPQKDQETLIRAFSRIAEAHPGWVLRIVGEGALRFQLEKIIEELGLANRVVLVGSTDRISEEYGKADIFAMSSIYESFGLVTAEAMAHKVAVVGFKDCPGTNELIQHGINGLLVDGPDRVQALAGGLEKLILEPKYRRVLGENGRRSVQQFEPARIESLWEKIIVGA